MAVEATEISRRKEQETGQGEVSLGFVVLVLAGIVIGLALASLLLPHWLPGLAFSLLGEQPRAYWFLSRGSAFSGYILLWLSMITGLIVTNKMARVWPGGPTAIDLHEYFSLLGMGFGLFHVLILLGDHYINYNLAQVLVPFASQNYRPLWVGVGQVSFYVGILVTFSFYIRRRITPRKWRLIHYLSFAQFLGVLIHGLLSGTDTSTIWAISLYWITGISLLFFFLYRILIKRASA